MKMLKSTLRIFRYHLASVKYNYFDDKTPREEVFLEQIGRNGVTLPALNQHLDRAGFPYSIGRFPDILSKHDGLIDRITSSLRDFHLVPEHQSLPYEERKKTLFDYVSEELSESLALDPKVFAQYRIDNRFRMSRAI